MLKNATTYFALLFLLLVGCNDTYTNHSAQPIKTSKPAVTHSIKSIKKETKQSYRVFGKNYQVLNSSENYEEQGFASWYGAEFDKRMTSSGERFNMFSMTAAHKTLPLSTYVLVTNLMNGREVIVKVNDRGPFVSNRIIDLSYLAAKKLGMLSLGIAQVRVKAVYPFG
jgi:rare lipoprotein A